MAAKYKVTINIYDENGENRTVLRGANMKFSERIIRFLFGDFTKVHHLKPEQTVESVDARETKEVVYTMNKVIAMLEEAAAITDIRSLTVLLQVFVDAVLEGSAEEKTLAEKEESKKKSKPKLKKKKPLTLEDIRDVCADKSRKGFMAELKEICKIGDENISVPQSGKWTKAREILIEQLLPIIMKAIPILLHILQRIMTLQIFMTLTIMVVAT